jgi:hypothetical protein
MSGFAIFMVVVAFAAPILALVALLADKAWEIHRDRL